MRRVRTQRGTDRMTRAYARYTPPVSGPISRYCYDCGQHLSEEKFSPSQHLLKGGHKVGYCKLCRGKRAQLERKKYPDAERGRLYRRKYGISVKGYEQMVQNQNGRCAICGTIKPNEKRRFLCIDHDHKTGRVRALLCTHCNRGLGCFRDSAETIQRAKDYLTKFKSEEQNHG